MLDRIKQKRQDGFTIIEVVIVLAIAGLIFLVVFLAVPQLQASRRDSQRRSDAARMGAALEAIAANSQGVYPPDATGVDYTANNLQDPSTGSDYAVSTTDPPDDGFYYYVPGGQCTDNGEITEPGSPPASPRTFAVSIGLEGGGASCYDVN